jgi:hypothetical protein
MGISIPHGRRFGVAMFPEKIGEVLEHPVLVRFRKIEKHIGAQLF